MPVRVAVVAYTEYPFDMRIRREVETLTRDGYEIDVIACRSDAHLPSLSLGGGILHEVPITIQRGGKARYLYQYCLFLLCTTVLLLYLHLRKRYDMVHVHSLPDFQVFCASPLRFLGVPVLLDLHEAMPEIFLARFKKGKDSLWFRAAVSLEQMSAQFASHVVAANDGIKSAVVSRGTPESRVNVIYNVGDEQAEPIGGAELRRALGLPSGVMIVHAGGVNPERDLETVIRALAVLPRRLDAHLVVAGGGDPDYVASLEKLAAEQGAADRFVFVGRLPLKRAKALMSVSSVGLISLERNPLTELAWPTRIAEFANLRKPLLVADLPFIHSVLGDCARYYKPGDAAALAAQLTDLLTFPSEAEGRTAQAERLCRKFSLTEMHRSLLSLYHAVCS